MSCLLICFFHAHYLLCSYSTSVFFLFFCLTSCHFFLLLHLSFRFHSPFFSSHVSCSLLFFSFYVPTPADSFLFSFRPSSFHSLHFLYLFFGQNVSFHQHSSQSQKVQERLKELEQEVSGGATAVVALILNNKLYIANVGMDTHI